MTNAIMEAIIRAAQSKDYGEHAQFGAWKANQKQTRKHLRRARLGKFAKGNGYYEYRADGYQATIEGSKEGQIKYDINSATVKGKELKGSSIANYQAALKEAVANERTTIKGIEIISYASPDGGEELNAKLSDKRSESAEKAWGKITKGIDGLEAPSTKSVGQDWEGFQEAVQKSDIQDKDLIVRVLSMYSDPEVREKEIKNMSAVYNELRKEVLPELRRTRFVATTEFRNYSDEELAALSGADVATLDETALLRLGAISEDPAKKESYYKAAADRFNSEAGKYNLALDLTVVPCENWTRDQYFDETGLTWVNPSPNMRSLDEALLYPGIGIPEFTNISVGRGTDTPFEVVGAPWIDGADLAAKLTESKIPGVSFEAIKYTPTGSKYKGEEVSGIRMTITDRDKLDAVKLGVALMRQLVLDYPEQWEQKNANTLLLSDKTLEAINDGKTVDEIAKMWEPALESFKAFRANFTIYR